MPQTHEEHMASMTPERRAKIEAISKELLAELIKEAINELEWLFGPERFPSYRDEWELIKAAALKNNE